MNVHEGMLAGVFANRFANIDAAFHYEDFGIVVGVQANLDSGANEYHLRALEEWLPAMFQEKMGRALAGFVAPLDFRTG